MALTAAGQDWYTSLLEPVRPQLAAAWARIPAGTVEPAAVPRAGLGGALVVHVARGWGTRRWQEEARVAVAAMEALNQLVQLGEPSPATREGWLATELRWPVALLTRSVRRDEALLRRVADRCLRGDDAHAQPVGEATLFLRAAVAAGVLVSAAPDTVHASLDAWAQALGPWLDARAAGGPELPPPAEAVAALEALPDAAARELLLGLRSPPPAGDPRAFSRWEPLPVPARPPPAHPLVATMLGALHGEGALPAAGRWLAGAEGKRLRPRIAGAAAVAVGGREEDALALGAEVEWVHTASLVLDDIVDEAELRRGEPPLHRLASTPFAAGVAGWLLLRTALREPALAETMAALAEGQRAELACSAAASVSREAWYAVAAQKTARLFSAAASLGGRAGGATPAQQKRLARFGQELGLAFQIVDDLLDVVGDASTLGKPPGQDLRRGRVGFPRVVLHERAPELGTVEAAALQEHDVVGLVEAQAQAHLARALSALDGLPGDTAPLAQLARACVERRT